MEETGAMGQTNSQTSFAGRIARKRNIIIVLVILAITVGHFVTQISFIESENKKIVESLAKSAPVIEPTDTEIAESNSQPLETKQTDEILLPKPVDLPKNVQPVKIVQKEARRQPEPAPLPNNFKKEAKGQSRAERLRRAEKLLTGF
jgi:type IV secretory pathway VirB10-like protein